MHNAEISLAKGWAFHRCGRATYFNNVVLILMWKCCQSNFFRAQNRTATIGTWCHLCGDAPVSRLQQSIQFREINSFGQISSDTLNNLATDVGCSLFSWILLEIRYARGPHLNSYTSTTVRYRQVKSLGASKRCVHSFGCSLAFVYGKKSANYAYRQCEWPVASISWANCSLLSRTRKPMNVRFCFGVHFFAFCFS